MKLEYEMQMSFIELKSIESAFYVSIKQEEEEEEKHITSFLHIN